MAFKKVKIWFRANSTQDKMWRVRYFEIRKLKGGGVRHGKAITDLMGYDDALELHKDLGGEMFIDYSEFL